jgi:hypothetical protein
MSKTIGHKTLSCMQLVMFQVYLEKKANMVPLYDKEIQGVTNGRILTNEERKETCCICLNTMEEAFDNTPVLDGYCKCGNVPMLTKCNHYIHLPCLAEYCVNSKGRTCPLCQSNLFE